MLTTRAVHGFPIVGYVFKEMQGDKETAIITLDRGEKTPQRYVTAWYRDGDREWSSGHYIDSFQKAIIDMTERAVDGEHFRQE